MYLDRNFGLRLVLSKSLNSNLQSLNLAIHSAKSLFDLRLDLETEL